MAHMITARVAVSVGAILQANSPASARLGHEGRLLGS